MTSPYFAPQQSSYRYVATDVVTGSVLADNLPLTVSSCGRALGQIGPLSGTLNLWATVNSSLRRAWVSALAPRRSMLWVYQDGYPVWAGIVTGTPHQSALDGTLPVSASTPEWLLQYRKITTALSWAANQDVLTIFRNLLVYALSKTPNGGVSGLTWQSPLAGIPVNISYDTTSLQSIYDAWNQLASTYGFEWSFRPALTGSGTPQIWVDHAYPQLGGTSAAAYTLPGNLIDYSFPVDGSSFANTLYGTASSGAVTLTSVQSNSADLTAGYPLIEDSVSWSATGFQSDLDAFVAKELDARSQSQTQPLLTLGSGMSPKVRDTNLGDIVTFTATTPLHPAYADGSPGLQVTGRITGWTLYPPGEQQTERTEIQLANATVTGTGPSSAITIPAPGSPS